jgi:hypothetical protein
MAGNKGKRQKNQRPSDASIEIGGNVDTGGGDIAAGAISKENVNIYRVSEMNTSTVNNLFQPIYDKLDELPELLPQERKILRRNIEEIQGEISKDKKSDKTFIKERLLNIMRMSSDIYEVVIATLANPIIGLQDVMRKIAKKASRVNAEVVKKNE